jgi:hypothetical protein
LNDEEDKNNRRWKNEVAVNRLLTAGRSDLRLVHPRFSTISTR